MKNLLTVGLVVKGGKEFIDKWLEGIEKIGCMVIVIDNEADKEVRNKLINHKQVKYYIIQHGIERNMSRDYQKILDIAKEEDTMWVWNVDIDEYISPFNIKDLIGILLNSREDSIGMPLIEMRNDDNHYIMIDDTTNKLKDARLCHKLYRTHSHFEFNKKDYHGCAIPHNCKPGSTINIILRHYGHYTKVLRDKKKKYYKNIIEDKNELNAIWMQEDDNVIIKHIKEFPVKLGK